MAPRSSPKRAVHPPSASRKARATAQTRLAILEAAARVLARDGREGTTMQSIAREAGYAAASLYGYFESKQDILAALGGALQAEILATFDEPSPRGLSFGQRLELLLCQQAKLADSRREMFLVFFQLPVPGKAAPCQPASSDPVATGLDTYARRLAEWMTLHAKASDLGGHTPEEAAHALVGLMHGLFLRWLARDGSEQFASQTASVLDLFLYGVQGRRAAAGTRRR